MDFKTLERFFSRKNEVYLIALNGRLYVLKRFKDKEGRHRMEFPERTLRKDGDSKAHKEEGKRDLNIRENRLQNS